MTADIARLRADAQYLNETGCRMVATWNIVNAANDHQQLTQEVERLKAQRAKDVATLKEAGANVVAERDRLRDIIERVLAVPTADPMYRVAVRAILNEVDDGSR